MADTNLPQATLVNGAGNRVAVPTGGQEAQQYFGQGYKLETTPPPAPAAPAATPPAAGGTATAAAPQGPQATTPSNSAFLQAFNLIAQKGKNQQVLSDAKNKLLTQLYDRRLSESEIAGLSPAQQSAIRSGDKSLIEYQVMSLNDSIKGRTDANMEALGYMLQGHKMDQEAADKAKADADAKRAQSQQTLIDAATKYDLSSLAPGILDRISTGTITSQDAVDLSKALKGQENLQLQTIEDPNNPGQKITGTYSNGVFTPVTMGSNPGSYPQTAEPSDLADAIKSVESNGNYDAKGDNGNSWGAYQYSKGTWDADVKAYKSYLASSGAEGPTAPMVWGEASPEEQDAVAQFKIQQLQSQGYTPDQIASVWNHGSPDYAGVVGTNAAGDKYDTPKYVDRVMGKLGGSAPQSGAAGTTGTNTIDSSSEGYSTSIVPKTGGLTQSAIDQAAITMLSGGTNPYAGSKATKGPARESNLAVAARFAELSAGTNAAVIKPQMAALSKSLAGITVKRTSAEASLRNADAGFQQVLKTFGDAGINANDSKVANKWVNDFSQNFTGGQINAFKSGMTEVATEYAQVVSRGGQMTDADKKTAKDIVDGNISMTDLKEVLRTIQDIGEITLQGYKNEESQITDEINGLLPKNVGATKAPTTQDSAAATSGQTSSGITYTIE